MARWFWYLSTAKTGALKRPEKGWSLLRHRLRTADLQAGVPWAKLSTHASPDPSAVETMEAVEREITRDHEVPEAGDINPFGSPHAPLPLFFRFEGVAGRIILRESYQGEDGECVLLVAGTHGTAGVLLLGSGAHIVGSTTSGPRFVNPSVDPVGALLVPLDRRASGAGYTRAGIARDADGLSVEARLSYSLVAALHEIRATSFTYRVRALAVTSAAVPFRLSRRPRGVTDDHHRLDRVIVGSPLYVEQLDAPDRCSGRDRLA